MEPYGNDALWVSFRLDGGNFCIDSSHIEGITVPGKLVPLPGSPAFVSGLMEYKGEILLVLEMRTLFHKMNLSEYTAQFSRMKDMHIEWVQELERCVRENVPFLLPVDPHRCQFGVWYDHYQTDHIRLKHILHKIKEPHERIHQYGLEITRMMQANADSQAIQAALQKAKEVCMEQIVPLLEQLIETYQEANQGMILVIRLGEQLAGLLVDEVTELTPCSQTVLYEMDPALSRHQYGRHIVMEKGEKPAFEVEPGRLLQAFTEASESGDKQLLS